MRRGFEVLPTVCWSMETLNWVDRHITSSLGIGRVYSDVIIKLPPISFTLHRTQEILYGHITCIDVSACVDMNKCWDKLDEASVSQAVHSLSYSYNPEWRQHFEKKTTILAYLYHVSNTRTTNDYKWAKIVLYLSRIYRVTPCCLWPNFRSDCDFMEIQSAPSWKCYKIPEKQNCNF